MPITDHVDITVRRTRAPVAGAGFGTLGVLDGHRLTEALSFEVAGTAELASDWGAATTDTIYRAAESYFLQSPSPATLLVGRRETENASVYLETDSVTSESTYVCTVAGLEFRITSAPSATSEMVLGKMVSEISGGYAVTAVVVGLGVIGVSGQITIADNHLAEFPAGQTFTIAGSTNNDATWTVQNSVIAAGDTEITVGVAQTVGAVADGRVGGYAITAATVGPLGTITIPGDQTTRFAAGLEFGVLGSTGNDNEVGSGTAMAGIPYTVGSSAVVAGATVITTSGAGGAAVLSAVADGGLVAWCDGAAATSTVLARMAGDTITENGWLLTAVAAGPPSTFTITGDATAFLPAGTVFRVAGEAGVPANNGAYTVATAVYGAPSTVITAIATEAALADPAPGPGADARVSVAVAQLSSSVVSDDEFYSVQIDDKLRLRVALAATVAADLTAIRADATDSFYGVMLTTRLEAQVLAAAAAVEGVTDAYKLFGTASGDTDIITTTAAADSPVTGSIAAQLAGLNYLRTFDIYSDDDAGDGNTAHGAYTGYALGEDDDDPFIEAAIMGRVFPSDPGATDWDKQALVGIIATDLTTAQRVNALAKNCNVYEEITSTADGFAVGDVVNDDPIDTVRGLDWLVNDMETRIFNLLWGENNAGRKVPYTDSGFAAIEGSERETIGLAVSRGVVTNEVGFEPTYTTPTRASMLAADVSARLATGFIVNVTLAGAIRKVEITLEAEI